MATKIFTATEVAQAYTDMTFPVTAECELIREMVGGQPGGEEGIRHFVEHHLKLAGLEAEAAVKRIMSEEIGERDVTPELGEVKEQRVYSVNVIRRDEHGPWIGDWMAKACLKAAASLLGIFKAKLGTKSAVAEMGRIDAVGFSRLGSPHRIYVRVFDVPEPVLENAWAPLCHLAPAPTYFREFPGHVRTPQGMRSILTQAECIGPGARFKFQLRLPISGKSFTDEEILRIFAAAGNIGLGSTKSFELGKFSVQRLEIDRPEKAEKE